MQCSAVTSLQSSAPPRRLLLRHCALLLPLAPHTWQVIRQKQGVLVKKLLGYWVIVVIVVIAIIREKKFLSYRSYRGYRGYRSYRGYRGYCDYPIFFLSYRGYRGYCGYCDHPNFFFLSWLSRLS